MSSVDFEIKHSFIILNIVQNLCKRYINATNSIKHSCNYLTLTNLMFLRTIKVFYSKVYVKNTQ